jgi:hypothetical protein
MTINESFKLLLSRIEPTAAQIEAVEQHLATIKTRLKTIFTLKDFLKTGIVFLRRAGPYNQTLFNFPRLRIRTFISRDAAQLLHDEVHDHVSLYPAVYCRNLSIQQMMPEPEQIRLCLFAFRAVRINRDLKYLVEALSRFLR